MNTLLCNETLDRASGNRQIPQNPKLSPFFLASRPRTAYVSAMLHLGDVFKKAALHATWAMSMTLGVALAEQPNIPQPPALPFVPAGARVEQMQVRTNRQATPLTRPVALSANGVGNPQPYPAPNLNPPVPFNTPAPGNPPAPLRPFNSTLTPPPPTLPPSSLAWDAESKEATAKVGDTNAVFTFWLTNVCDKEVLVNSVRTSCGCTVAKLPESPWRLGPGTNGPIGVTVDLRGKRGKVMKTVTVDTTAGVKSLLVGMNIPVDPKFEAQMNRSQNMQLAFADRQIVFRGDCAKCHAEPVKEKMGKDLYAAACGVCHEAEHRASMVPDLKALKHPTDLAFWTHWIREGKAGSLMPAFAAEHGGPLTDEQVTSLANWLTENYKGQPATAIPVSTPTK